MHNEVKYMASKFERAKSLVKLNSLRNEYDFVNTNVGPVQTVLGAAKS